MKSCAPSRSAIVHAALLALGGFASTQAAVAQSASAPAAAAPARPAPCATAAHRQFDFWLGDWEVRQPDGTPVGRNAITAEYGGCVLHERYTTGRRYAGESLNAFDPARGVWHQTWVDNGGLLLLLEGGLRDGRMVMEGRTTGADGAVTRHRISWTPLADGSVRQHWETAPAEGDWSTAFDGHYVRR